MIEEALVALLLEPECVKEFNEAMIDFKIQLLDDMLEYYPIDGVEMMDDYGHQTNAFMSVETWEELYGPALKKFADYCKEKGVIFQLHSCGKVESLIPSFIKYGVHHWASCQPMNDLEGILHNYGDQITLWEGGFLLADLDQESITEEVTEHLYNTLYKLYRGGSFIGDIWDFDESIQGPFRKFIEENKYTYYEDPEHCKLP